MYLRGRHDSDPPTTTYYWVNANKLDRFYKATTNGNWIDIQTHEVKVNYGGETDCETHGIITIIFDFNECAIDVPESTLDDHSIELYPNPNHGSFSLVMQKQVEDLNIRIFDMKGQEVYTEFKSGKWPEGHRHNISAGVRSGSKIDRGRGGRVQSARRGYPAVAVRAAVGSELNIRIASAPLGINRVDKNLPRIFNHKNDVLV